MKPSVAASLPAVLASAVLHGAGRGGSSASARSRAPGGRAERSRDRRRGRRERPWRQVPLLLLAASLSLGGCRPGEQTAVSALPVGIEVGQRAPELTGTRGDGGPYQLAAQGAGTVAVFFRGFGCGLCRERLQELQTNLPLYQRSGISVVAVTPDPPASVREAAGRLGLSYPVVSVETATLARWGVIDADESLPLPATYLVDGRGVVLYRHIGRNAADRASDVEVLAVLQ